MFFIVLFIILFLFNLNALAEEKFFDEIVVTASRIEEPRKDLPVSIQIVSQEEIKTSVSKNAGDLIIETASGHITKYPGLNTTVYLRGFGGGADPTGARNLILIDGHRASTINLATIPTHDIEKIEVLKGPSSVIYGSNAMGGVINIITKETEEEGIHGFFGLEGGSWDRRKVEGELKFKKSPFDIFLSASYSDSSDYETKDYGKIINSGYSNESVSFKLGYEIAKGHKISLGFQHWRGWEIGSPGPLSWQTPRDYSDILRNSFNVLYKSDILKVEYYYSKEINEFHDDFGIYKYKTATQGINVLKTFFFGDHRILIGGEWNRVNMENKNTPPPPYKPKSEYDNYGAFTEVRFSLLDKKLLIYSGIRYDYFKNELLPTEGMAVKAASESLDHITIRGGTVYKISDSLSIRANVGNAFRAPSPNEYAGEYIFWGTRYIGNPELKPEKAINYEGGFDFNKSGFKGSLTFFHSLWKDKIVSYYDTLLSGYSFKNEKKATIQGWEANISYELSELLKLGFSLEPFLNITYHTKYSSEEGSLLYTPKWLVGYGIKAGAEKWDCRFIVNYIGREFVEYYDPITWSSKIIKKSGFTVANFKALYRPVKAMEISFAVENLFDRKYEYILDYPMPRRAFTLGMKWLF